MFYKNKYGITVREVAQSEVFAIKEAGWVQEEQDDLPESDADSE